VLGATVGRVRVSGFTSETSVEKMTLARDEAGASSMPHVRDRLGWCLRASAYRENRRRSPLTGGNVPDLRRPSKSTMLLGGRPGLNRTGPCGLPHQVQAGGRYSFRTRAWRVHSQACCSRCCSRRRASHRAVARSRRARSPDPPPRTASPDACGFRARPARALSRALTPDSGERS